MKKIVYIISLVTLLWTSLSAQLPVPAGPQTKPIAITGVTAHLGTGQVMTNATIVFNQGKITAVGTNATVPTGTEVINLQGKHVYPGFILVNSQLGLTEVSSIRAMADQEETGNFNPNIRSVISYNTDSNVPPTLRVNGICLAEVAPVGGIISGTSSVMEMDGWNWEDAVHSMDIAMHMNWPAKMRRQFDFNTFSINMVPNDRYAKEVEEMNRNFSEALAYGQNNQTVKNLKMEAMQGLFSGQKTLMIHANEAKEIIESVRFAQDKKVKKVVIVGAENGLAAAAFLKDNNIPVVLPAPHNLPGRVDDDVDFLYKLPFLFHQQGVSVVLMHNDDNARARNLPFYAGTAAAFGMDKEEALKTITSNAAKALGIDQRVGTIEVGKDATLFISEGDALDMRTNIPVHVFIRGKKVNLETHQEVLYKKFADKYGIPK